jgi:O-antigen ligase
VVIATADARRGAVWLGFAAILATMAAVEPRVSLLPAAALITLLVWRWTDVALSFAAIAILAIRPSLDIFSNSKDPTASLALRPASVLGLSVILTAAVVAAKRLRDGRPFWTDIDLGRIHYWLFAAYGIGVISGTVGYGAEGLLVGVREAVRVASTISALLLVLWWVEGRPERYQTGWTLLFLGTIPPLLTATTQWITGKGYLETEGLNRLYGTFSHPQSLGPYLVPFILFAVGGLLAASWRGRIFRILLIGYFTLILALTYSRTALLVLLAGFMVLPFLHARRLGLKAFARSMVAVAAVMTIGWFLAGGMIKARFSDISVDREVLAAALAGHSDNSFTWRILNWGILVRMGAEKPAIGHGAAMTTVLNPLVNVDYGGKPFNAHNDFVRWFFEAGVLGLACYLIYGVLLCRWTLRKALSSSREAAPGAFAIAAALISMMFLSLGTTEYSSQTAVLYQFNGILALLTVVPVRNPTIPTPIPRATEEGSPVNQSTMSPSPNNIS